MPAQEPEFCLQVFLPAGNLLRRNFSNSCVNAKSLYKSRYYPVFLNLSGAKTLVVGGGSVAERKIKSLLQAGAGVTQSRDEVVEEQAKKIKLLEEEVQDLKTLVAILEGKA